MLTQQFCCAPSECPQAIEGFALFQPVIEALQHYKTVTGEYPETLEDLIPEYIAIMPSYEIGEVTYSKIDDGYELRFEYYGPGINQCSYTPNSKKWDCFGYY